MPAAAASAIDPSALKIHKDEDSIVLWNSRLRIGIPNEADAASVFCLYFVFKLVLDLFIFCSDCICIIIRSVIV